MLGDNGKTLIANTSKSVGVSRTLTVSLSTNYIHELDVITKQPGAYATNFEYKIKYAPMYQVKKLSDRPFLILIDMFDTVEKSGHRFKDYDDFLNSEKFKEFIPFLLKYTNISKDLFDLAKNNTFCNIPISFDIVKYVKDVKKKYKQDHAGKTIKDFCFMTEHVEKANAYLGTDKRNSRISSKRGKLKGVVEKCT